MKKLIVLLVMICGIMPLLWASDGCDQHLSPEEFRAKQKAFITEKAGLTSEEAAKFFPLYFELQDRKKQLNDEAWKLLGKGKMKKQPKPSMRKLWKVCMMPVLLLTGWTRPTLINSRRYCLVKRFIWCKELKCVSIVNC